MVLNHLEIIFLLRSQRKDNNEVPLSEMARDLLNTYKYGWKTSYYHNTYDSKSDGDEVKVEEQPIQITQEEDPENCEACTI